MKSVKNNMPPLEPEGGFQEQLAKSTEPVVKHKTPLVFIHPRYSRAYGHLYFFSKQVAGIAGLQLSDLLVAVDIEPPSDAKGHPLLDRSGPQTVVMPDQTFQDVFSEAMTPLWCGAFFNVVQDVRELWRRSAISSIDLSVMLTRPDIRTNLTTVMACTISLNRAMGSKTWTRRETPDYLLARIKLAMKRLRQLRSPI